MMKVRYAGIPNGPALELEGPTAELLPVLELLLDRTFGGSALAAPAGVPVLPNGEVEGTPGVGGSAASGEPSSEGDEVPTEPRARRNRAPAATPTPKTGRTWGGARRKKSEAGLARLSTRAVKLQAKGWTTNQIANELGVAWATVRTLLRDAGAWSGPVRAKKAAAKPEPEPEPEPPAATGRRGDLTCPKCSRTFTGLSGRTRHQNAQGHFSTDPETANPSGAEAPPLDEPAAAELSTVDTMLQNHLRGVTPYSIGKGFDMTETRVNEFLDAIYHLANLPGPPAGTKALRQLYTEMGPEDRHNLARRLLREHPALFE